MPSFIVEYKKKSANGFTHIKDIVNTQDDLSNLYNRAVEDGVDGIEFFVARAVKPKPEPKAKPEVKK